MTLYTDFLSTIDIHDLPAMIAFLRAHNAPNGTIITVRTEIPLERGFRTIEVSLSMTNWRTVLGLP